MNKHNLNLKLPSGQTHIVNRKALHTAYFLTEFIILYPLII